MELVNGRKRVQRSIERRTRLEGRRCENQADKKSKRSHMPMVQAVKAALPEARLLGRAAARPASFYLIIGRNSEQRSIGFGAADVGHLVNRIAEARIAGFAHHDHL
jgi:hypothetical protein